MPKQRVSPQPTMTLEKWRKMAPTNPKGAPKPKVKLKTRGKTQSEAYITSSKG